MITQFKIFEVLQSELEVGDYVLMRSSVHSIVEFINNTIGKIIGFDYDKYNNIKVTYDNIPEDLRTYWFNNTNDRDFNINQVVEFSKNKEELELKLAAKKYNL